MKETILKIFKESMAIKSFSHTESEGDIEAFIDRKLRSLPYFKERPDLCGRYALADDVLGRSLNWALVQNGGADTVILFHHHDTVDIEDFGSLKHLAFDHDKLQVALAATSKDPTVLADIASQDWYFGRGSCDMKAALALQLGVLAEYSQLDKRKVNLLYLSVPDEESYSQGMRAATGLLLELKDKYRLNYLLAIDSEPFESNSDQEKVLHIGTVGKILPVLLTQGILSHMKEPLTGVNAISLLSRIVEKLDLNPALADQALGVQAPLPSWSYMRDLKDNYDVSTVLHAAACLSLLYLKRSPADLLTSLKDLIEEAIDDFYNQLQTLQQAWGEKKQIERPRLLSYQELLAECQEKEGFTSVKEELDSMAREAWRQGQSYQEITIFKIQRLLDFYQEKEALVILALAPPYYPSLSCRKLQEAPINIEAFIKLYENFLAQEEQEVKLEEYFMGICDLSYCALDQPLEVYQDLMASLALPADLYHIDFEQIAALQIPAVNLGPWGKDLHQISERVYKKDMLETIPNFLLYLLENIEQIKSGLDT
ncbi:M20/M25/M40 family metallo-hydrolase [Streptococcus oricebi]|uniref:Peptidase M20 n=1 Tax=Streptococcus oricebi TaxID=1547447 RepID=A0ABS5B360_9STRE|nr:M20/M25/M40 family metallo-hydrolase [Streptococcus oricebi]MBP2622399.1 peptidase M20 [Streptococcus oricebi]